VADNTVYQLTIGLNVEDAMSDPTSAAAQAMNGLLHSVEALEAAGVDATFQQMARAASDLNNSMVFDSMEEALRGVPPAAEEATESLDNAARTLERFKGHGVDKLLGLIKGRLWQIGEAAQEGQKWMEDFTGELAGGNGSMVEFEDFAHKIAVGLGGAGERAQYLRSEIIQLGGATQFGVGEITRLAHGLHMAGAGLDEFGTKTQGNMIALAEVFNVAGEDIARTGKTMEIFGGSLGELLDETTAFQDGFGIPGAFQALPQVIDGAMEAFTEFGGSVTGGGKQIISDVMHMSGVYAKAFGKTMADAVSEAQQTYSRFANVTKTNRRVFLGLADDFDPLQKAFMEVGLGVHQSAKLAKDAQGDVVGFVDTVRGKIAGMNPWRKSRFLEQMRDELHPSVMNAIEDVDAFNKMLDAQADAAARTALNNIAGQRSFDELSTEMLNTTKELRTMWFNTKALIKATLVQTGVTDALKSAFRGAKDVLADFGAGLEEVVRSDEFQVWAERMKPILAGVGKAVLLVGGAFGSFAGAVGTLMAGRAGLKMFSKVSGSLTKNVGRLAEATGSRGLGAAAKGMTGIGKAFAFIGAKGAKIVPGLGQAIAAFSGVKTAVNDMGEVMGDPNATGMEKFEALTRGTIKGVGGAIDGMLLGLPSFILDKFFPDLERSFDQGFESLFGGVREFSLTEAISESWDSATTWLGNKIRNLDKFFHENLPDMRESMSSFGRNLGSALGGMIELGLTGVKAIVIDFPAWIGGQIMSAFSSGTKKAAKGVEEGSSDIGGAFMGIFGSLQAMILDFGKGLVDGLVAPFHTSFDEMAVFAKMSLNNVAVGALDMTASIIGGIFKFTSLFQSGMKVFTDSGDRGWAVFKLAGLEAFGAIIDTFLGSGGFVSKILEGFEKLAFAFGMDDMMMSINEARKGMEGFSSSMTADAKVLSDQIADEADLTKVWADAKTKANMAAAEGTKGILAQKKELEGYNNTLEDSLGGLKKERETRETNATEARIWAKDRKKGLDAVFAAMEQRADFGGEGGLNSQGQAQARKSIRNTMDSAIAEISKGVRDGSLTTVQATKALAEAQRKGIDQAISGAKQAAEAATGKPGRTAGGAAAAARDTGRRGGGLSSAQLTSLQRGLMKANGGGQQKVQVWLRGAGPLNKAIAKESAVKNFNQGN
jgi:hypothetical protein